MAFRNILLLSLLLAIALATPEQNAKVVLPKSLRMAKAWQLRALRRARARLRNLLQALANLGTSSRCNITRRRRINALLIALRKARTCRYRGIGYKEYSRLRALCRDRSEIRDDIALYYRICARKRRSRKSRCIARKVVPLRQKLRFAFQACHTIGWKGDGRAQRNGCPSVMNLKKQLRAAEAIRCGRAPARRELLKDIKKTKARIAYLLRLIRPVPSSKPRPVRG